jgi:Protein of unknown function (DUF3489)
MTPKTNVATTTAPETALPTTTPAPIKVKKTAPKGKAKTAKKTPVKGKAKTAPAPAKKTAAPAKGGSKKAQAIALAEKGVSIDKLMKTFGWQRHTVRGFFSVLGKTRKVTSAVVDGHLTYTVK